MDKKYYLGIFLILILAIFLRLYYVDYNREITIGGDESAYSYSAKNIIKYHKITNDRYGEMYNGNEKPISTTNLQIGYPLYLAFFYLFSDSNTIIFISQCMMSLLNIILVWKIMDILKIKKKTILFILLLFAIYPGNIYNINRLLTENLFTTLFLIFIYFYLYWMEENKNYIYLFLASIFLTFSIFVRGTALPFLFLCFIHILIYSRDKLKSLLSILIPFFICEIPWIIRNYTILNKICILTEANENPKIWGAMPYYLDMNSSNNYTLSELINNDLIINKFLFFRWRIFGFLQYMFGDVWDEGLRHVNLGKLLFIQYIIIIAVLLIPVIIYNKDKKILFIAAIPLGWVLLLMPYHALPRYIFPIIPIIFILLGKEIDIIYSKFKNKKYIKYSYVSCLESLIWKIFKYYSVIFSLLLFISIFIFAYFINFEMSEWRLNKYYNVSINEVENIYEEGKISYNYGLDNMILNNMIQISNKKFKSDKEAPAIIELPVKPILRNYNSSEKVVTKITVNSQGGYLFDQMTVYWNDTSEGKEMIKFNENKVYKFPINILQDEHTVYIDGDVTLLLIVPSVFANNSFTIDSIDVTKYKIS